MKKKSVLKAKPKKKIRRMAVGGVTSGTTTGKTMGSGTGGTSGGLGQGGQGTAAPSKSAASPNAAAAAASAKLNAAAPAAAQTGAKTAAVSAARAPSSASAESLFKQAEGAYRNGVGSITNGTIVNTKPTGSNPSVAPAAAQASVQKKGSLSASAATAVAAASKRQSAESAFRTTEDGLRAGTGVSPSFSNGLISSTAPPKGYESPAVEAPQSQVNALRDVMQSQIGMGRSPFTKDMNTTVQHLAGEVGVAGLGSGQVANTMINRTISNNTPGTAKYNNSLDASKQWASAGNPAFNAATPGSTIAGKVAGQAVDELMRGVPAPNATDFRAVRQKNNVATKKAGVDVAGNRFGNFEGVSGAQMADMRGIRGLGGISNQGEVGALNSAIGASSSPAVNAPSLPDPTSLGLPRSVLSNREKIGVNPTKYGSPIGPDQLKYGSPIGPDLARYGSPIGPDMAKYGAPIGPDMAKYGAPIGPDLAKYGAPIGPDLAKYGAPVGPRIPGQASGTFTSPYDVKTTIAGDPRVNMAPNGLQKSPLRGPAETYTSPYDVRTTTPIDPRVSMPPGGFPQAHQGIPEPDVKFSPSDLPAVPAPAAPPAMSDAEMAKWAKDNLPDVGSYIKSGVKGFSDYMTNMDRFKQAHTFAGRMMGYDKVADKKFSEAVTQGVSALGSAAKQALTTSLNAAAGIGALPTINPGATPDGQRAVQTVAKAEGTKAITDRVPTEETLGAASTTLGSPTRGLSAPGKIMDRLGTTESVNIGGYNVQQPTEEGAVFDDPMQKQTVAYQKGSPNYDKLVGMYDRATAAPLTDEEARVAAKEAGFRPNVYENDAFTSDPDQLGVVPGGVTGEGINALDMSKIQQRALAQKYPDIEKNLLTPAEKTESTYGGLFERAATMNPLGKIANYGIRKGLNIESTDDYLGRPSYEKKALRGYAADANEKYGRTPGVGGPSGMASIGPNNPGSAYGLGGQHADWARGVNIPNPGDPAYSDYQLWWGQNNAWG